METRTCRLAGLRHRSIRRLYRDQIGFKVDHDQTVDENIRFVQCTPPGSACSIAFGKGLVPNDQGPIKTLQMVVTDIEPAHADLKSTGVAVSDIADLAWGSFVYFADPDGNAWAVQQIVPRSSPSLKTPRIEDTGSRRKAE